jgi:hypothetical protein
MLMRLFPEGCTVLFHAADGEGSNLADLVERFREAIFFVGMMRPLLLGLGSILIEHENKLAQSMGLVILPLRQDELVLIITFGVDGLKSLGASGDVSGDIPRDGGLGFNRIHKSAILLVIPVFVENSHQFAGVFVHLLVVDVVVVDLNFKAAVIGDDDVELLIVTADALYSEFFTHF